MRAACVARTECKLRAMHLLANRGDATVLPLLMRAAFIGLRPVASAITSNNT